MTSARVVGIPDAHLDVHPTALRQDQRSPHLQLLDRSASGYRGGVQGEFDKSGARQQCGAQNRVVGHPRVRREREPPREQHLTGVGQPKGTADKRMFLPSHAEPCGRDVTDTGGRGLGPVVMALEGVGG